MSPGLAPPVAQTCRLAPSQAVDPRSAFRVSSGRRSAICMVCGKFPCRGCGVGKPNDVFGRFVSNHDWCRGRRAIFFARKERVCASAETTLRSCAVVCKRKLGRLTHGAMQIEKRLTQLVCQGCSDADAEKEREARLFAVGKWQSCTCGLQLERKVECPTRPSCVGERLRPGCDTMARGNLKGLAKRRRWWK